jgi:hypothetical protein
MLTDQEQIVQLTKINEQLQLINSQIIQHGNWSHYPPQPCYTPYAPKPPPVPVNRETQRFAKHIVKRLKRYGDWSAANQADGSIRLYSGNTKRVRSVTLIVGAL